MASAADVIIRFLADSTSVQKEVAKVQGTGRKISTWAKGVGLAIGGAFAIHAITDFVNAAQEADSVSRGLQQALKNAGDETGAWARSAEELASALSRKVGVDDEVIKKGQIILATFHNLSSETGQTSGAFDRASRAAVDLAKAGFGDVDSAAKALGKALEDPEKGIAALSKAGVTFEPIQKEQIKAFLAAGDTAGAMGVVLDRVEGQVGGVAEATATSTDKMNVAWGETKEALGRALVPVLLVVAPLLLTMATYIEKNAGWLVPLTIGIVAVVVAVKLWIGAQNILNGLLRTFGIEVGIAIGPILIIAIAILAAYAAVVLLYAKWDQVWTAIGNMPWYAKVAILIFALTNPILLLILTAAFLAVKWDQIWGFIKSVTGSVVGFLTDRLGEVVAVLKRIYDMALNVARAIKDIPKGPRGILDVVTGSGGGIAGLSAGGIVARPTLAVIGESGPEAVVPLSRGSSPALAGGGNVTINITTTGLGADAPSIQRAVVDAVRGYVGRNGPITGIAG